MHEWLCCCNETANHQLPIAAVFWILQIMSTEECSSLMQNLMCICCSTSSVILNEMTTQYTRSLSGVYHPHWPVQWSRHCSWCAFQSTLFGWWLLRTVTQTVFIILATAGFFLDRPCLWYEAQNLKEAQKLKKLPFA